MERADASSGSNEFRQHGLILLPAMAGIMFCSIHGYSLGVMIAPLDPWDRVRQFDGEVREFTVWNAALNQVAIKSLMKSAQLP